ncbi:MAG: hypothetical protein O2960_20380 [Verrucomicrobia bacterium]|nr:hypothetical protein [Verrucomicrobiota bacterium]
MSAAEVIKQIQSMSQDERDEVFATLLENEAWREDLADLLTIEARRTEPTRPIDNVFNDLGINE